MNRDPGISSAAERLAETTRGYVAGWRIPEGIPLQPETAILPLRPDPDMVRTATRVMHALLVRTCPDAVLVIGTRGDGGSRPAIVSDGSIATGLGPVSIDIGRAARCEGRLGDRVEAVPGAEFARLAPDPGFATIPLLLQVLAPGCRILPILLPAESDPTLGDELGSELADLFDDDGVVLIAPLELSEVAGSDHASAPKERLRARDAELLRPLLALDLDGVARKSVGSVSAPAVLATAVRHASARGAALGHLIEYVRSPVDATGSGSWSGRAGIIF